MLWLGTLHGGPAISAIERVYARLGGLEALKRDAGRLRPAQCAGFFADFAVGVVGCKGISLAVRASSRISLARMGPATEVDP